jgi:hypothetical protein
MKRTNPILTALFVVITAISLDAQGTTLPSAAMRITPQGYQYISVTNTTAIAYSVTIAYKLTYQNGETVQEETVKIIDPGRTESAYECARKSDRISDVKVVNLRKYGS